MAVVSQQPAEDEGGSPEGGQEGAGRPTEGGTYDTDDANMGRDPLGKKTDVGTESAYHSFRNSPNTLESIKRSMSKVKTKKMIIESLKTDDESEEFGMSDESNLLDDTI